MLHTVPRVVALWGFINGALTSIMIAYNENVFAIALYACAAGLIELVALAAWSSWTLRPGRATFTPAPSSGYLAFVAASGILFLGLGFAYRPWMMLGAAYPALNLLAHLVRRLLPSPPADGAGEPPPAYPAASTAPSAGAQAAAGVGVVTVSALLLRLVRRRRSS